MTETENRRNGFGEKTIQGSFGETKISVPRDREGTFEPVIVPKRKKDVSEIEGKVLAMYARGMSQRDISSTIQDIYGFELSQDKISTITDTILEDVKEWLNRPLKPLYSFVFVDCIYVKMKNDHGVVDNHAVYVILGVDAEGFSHANRSGDIWLTMRIIASRRQVKASLIIFFIL